MRIWIFIFFYSFTSLGQEVLVENVGEFIGVDIFENYYYLQKGALHKKGLDNDYLNINYGTPDDIDLSNPLQILLFYKFFNKVVLIDNQLSFIAEYTLPIGTEHIASAGKNKLWIYNNLQLNLSIYNLTTKKTEIRSVPLTYKIIQLKGNLNEAIAINHEKERLVFNYVAQKTHQQKTNNHLYPISLHPPYFIAKNLLWASKDLPVLKTSSISSFEVMNEHFYYFKENTLYRIPIPKK